MKILIIIRNLNTNPHFNLACEQYLLDNVEDEIFMLWRNDKTVVIGKNQNAYAEVNTEFVRENNIKVARRITGGGAVFHDLGNVNFTFITSKENADSLNFDRFTAPIIKALGKLGASAEPSGRNDITIDGKKVSGNAQCVYNGRVMHHGTLLYSADMSKVSGALNVDTDKIKSKGIKSIRSRVANIIDYIDKKMDVCDFITFLESQINAPARELSSEETEKIHTLCNEKYSTWDWIWGRSKSYSTINRRYFPFGLVEVCIDTDRGKIANVRIFGDYFGVCDISEIEKALTGIQYDYSSIINVLSGFNLDNYIYGSKAEDITKLLCEKPLL